MRFIVVVALLLCIVQNVSSKGRIKSLFDEHPTFNADLLIQVFNEKVENEWLLTETEDLTDELLTEFPEWIEKHKIGEYTHKG